MPWLEALWRQLQEDAVALGQRLPGALLIAVVGWVLSRILSSGAHAVIEPHPQGATLAPLLRSVVRVVVLAATAVMALDHLGVPVATVLAGAGIVGLAVGVRAPALVEDL